MKATKWFHLSSLPAKKQLAKIVKMTRVITSCRTLSCIRVNGPPLPMKPMRLAGTWNEYSARAMTHEKRITA